jgi:hypothetical protein
MKRQPTWKLIAGEGITAGIFLGDILIGKVARIQCQNTGAISYELRTLGEVRRFAELPEAMRAMGIDGDVRHSHASLAMPS